MKSLTLILSILGLISIASAQTSGSISFPVNGEVTGQTYAGTGTASTSTPMAVIPAFVTATGTVTMGASTITFGSSPGTIVNGEVISYNSGTGMIQPGTVVSSAAGNPVLTMSRPATASGSINVTFASVYFNLDGVAGCGIYCATSTAVVPGVGTQSTVYSIPIYSAFISPYYPANISSPHTLSLTVVDSAGNTSTTANTPFYTFLSVPTGCATTVITASISCMDVAQGTNGGTPGPTAQATLPGTGTFMAGDVAVASIFLLRPKSPYITSISGPVTATQTNVSLGSFASAFTGTASTTNASATITLDGTSWTQLCTTSPAFTMGQVIAGTPGLAAGTTVIQCLTSNQVRISQPAIATASGTPISIQYAWPSVTSIGAATINNPGTGYVVGDILSVGGGSNGEVLVTSTNPSTGAITGLVVVASTPAKFYTSSGYSNMTEALSGGHGMSATADIIAGFVMTISDNGGGPGYEKWLVTCVTSCAGGGITVQRGFAGTANIPHSQGIVGAYNPGPYPVLPSYLTDTAGNFWILAQSIQTENTDINTVPLAQYYTVFTSGTAAIANMSPGTDTLTFTHPYAYLNQVSLTTVRYRGLGKVSGLNIGQPTNGFATPERQSDSLFNASMTLNQVVPTATGVDWPVSPGDLCVVTAAGSPFMVANSGFGNALIYPLGQTGTVTTLGNTITLASGPPFPYSSVLGASGWGPGFVITVNSMPYHIAAMVDSMHITTVESLPTNTTEVPYSFPDLGAEPNPSTGWLARVQDPSRVMMIDNIATGTQCNGGARVTNVDGMFTLGIAFHPAEIAVSYGQSAQVSASNYLHNASVPATDTTSGAGGVEFEIDNISSTGNDSFLVDSTLGVTFQITQVGGGVYSISSSILPFNTWSGIGTCGGNGYSAIISNIASVGGNYPVYVRYQADFSTKTDYFEVWDGTGARIYASFCSWTALSGSVSAGVTIGGVGMAGSDNLQVGFLWQHSNILPMNSKMPTFGHANTNCIYDWHLDSSTGNTADSCAGTYTLSPVGSPTYPNTPAPVQALIKSVPVQAGTQSTSISGWKTLPVGGSQQMDCNAQSITQFNGSDVMSTCAWGQTIGTSPSTLSFTSTSAAQPTISNILATNTSSALATDYIVTLSVIDANSNAASGSIEMGAVPMDANGVVTNITGNAAQFFPPLMSYGNVPWGETDTLQYGMIAAQQAYQAANNQYQQALTPPSAGGTISYPFTAKGEGFGIAGTTVCTIPVGPTDTTITVCDITKISSPFPTWIMLGAIGGNNAFEI